LNELSRNPIVAEHTVTAQYSPTGFHIVLPPEVSKAVRYLVRAHEYAADSRTDPWQFAVSLTELLSLGASRLDLRWMLVRGMIEHGQEATVFGDASRTFRRLPVTSIPDDASFVLTPQGAQWLRFLALGVVCGFESAEHLRGLSGAGPDGKIRDSSSSEPVVIAEDQAKLTPHWDAELRQLSFNGRSIKRYRVPARNQELILSAFEEEGWPESIDDPLPPVADIDSRRRLQATIKSLNRHQTNGLIRFRGNGGERVLWQLTTGKD
jgi:hypothetical protein